PTIMNIKLVIPFVIAPVVNAIITYWAMDWGLVSKPIGAIVPWTTPPVIAGFLVTGGAISGALLNIVCIAIDMLIYYNFFRADDRDKLYMEFEEERKSEEQEHKETRQTLEDLFLKNILTNFYLIMP